MLSRIFSWLSRLISALQSTPSTSEPLDTPASLPASSPESSDSPPSTASSLAWGLRVSAAFRARVIEIAREVGTSADYIMACIAFETGETFSPSVRNGAGSGATGLIQFMPATARGLGTTTEALAAMTAEAQLEYVLAYLWPYRGRLRTLSDVYMAILWPAAIGRPDDGVLWDRDTRPTTYRQNAGLDANGDGRITKGEAAAKVAAKLARGRLPENLWRG